MDNSQRKLIKETRWSRTYALDNLTRLYESKFLVDDIRVALDELRVNWSQLSLEEKLDFAKAFAAKRQIRTDDEQVLDFLMTNGPEEIWVTIATRLPSHQDKLRVLSFLRERIDHGHEPQANYYQAIEMLKASEEVSLLKRKYEQYGDQLGTGVSGGRVEAFWYDYLQCCKVLFSLTGNSVYLERIKEAQTRAQPAIRSFASLLIREISQSELP